MLNGQIERELAEIEPWLLWQLTSLSDQQHLVEPELGRRDIHDETLLHHTEHFGRSPSSWTGTSKPTTRRLH